MVDVNPEIVKGEGDRSSRSRVNHPQETPQLEWRGVVDEYEIDTSEDTDELYHRVMELSDNIQQKLEESTGSYRRQSMSDTIPVGEGRSGDENRTRSNNSPQTTADSTDIPDSATPTSGCPSSADTRRPTASSCSSQVSEKGGFHFEDAKTQKAYERMLKLDEKLANVCRREREVKERRRLLEEEMERVGAGQPTNELMARGKDYIGGGGGETGEGEGRGEGREGRGEGREGRGEGREGRGEGGEGEGRGEGREGRGEGREGRGREGRERGKGGRGGKGEGRDGEGRGWCTPLGW